MSFFRYYFNYTIEDIASLIVQVSFAASIFTEILNLEYKDAFKENIVVKPTPSKGVYNLLYIFSHEGMLLCFMLSLTNTVH